MRILVFETDVENQKRIRDYAENHFGLLRDCKPQYVFVQEYAWEYLAEPFASISWRRGEFDAVIVASCLMKREQDGDEGYYGLVIARESEKLGIPCVLVVPEENYWMYSMVVNSFPESNVYSFGFDLRSVLLKLCDEFEKRGISYD